MASRKHLIVVLRGPREDGNHGTIVERGVDGDDLDERERYWHDMHAPCETYALHESDEESTIDADEHRAVAPVDTEAMEREEADRREAEEAAERERLERVAG